jgi:hypothetical protein
MKAPKCPAHVCQKMKLVGTISRTTFAGRRTVTGHRFRCPVENCPFCETVLIEAEDKSKTIRSWTAR